MNSQSVFLIDGTAFCYRAFYAIRSLSTADGRPTNAVFGFARMLQALRDKHRPAYLAVAFDVGKPTFRHRQFEAYKEQRKPMPDPLIAQLPLVKRLLAAYRIPVFEQEGYEAEDVLATVARQVAGDGIEVFLVTGDKDALQLVNTHITVFNPHKDNGLMDAAAVKARYGLAPAQLVDLMALMGDQIDNIPSVPGIGEKTAVQLLQQFGSVDALYAQLDQVESPARREALAAARDQVRQARELARIHTDVPVQAALDDLRAQEPDWRALRALFRELEFKKLLEAIDDAAPAQHPESVAVTVVSADALAAVVAALRGAAAPVAVLCWPIAAANQPAAVEAVIVALAVSPEQAWVVWLDRDVLASPGGVQLAAWLADPSRPKINHDAKRAIRSLHAFGVAFQGLAGDTMLAAYLVNSARTSQTLSDLCAELLDQALPPLPAAEPGSLLGPEALEPYGYAAAAVLRAQACLSPKLSEAGLDGLYRDLELPLVSVLADMEAAGVAIDRPYLAGLKASLDARLASLVEEVYRLAGCEFNINSPKQLAQVLFERLQLPVVKRTKTGPSTDADVLQQLAARHPLPERLLQYRELAKLVSTYIDALPRLADPATGRIHTTFNQAATATGRLSSSDPNLQNIPIKTELGRSIRKAFIPGAPDAVLVTADYSQIELRLLAHGSGDERLCEAFRQGHDIHRFTASLIYGIPEAQVTPDQRSAIKAINFGILYGMSAHGLSRELGGSHEEAQAFIDAYFERYPKVRAYLQGQIDHARRHGFVQTLLGRRRYVPELASPDAMMRQFGERIAINAPLQGTAADLIKRAMVRLAARLREARLESRMVLHVHDELVLEAPRRELDRLLPLVRDTMESAIDLCVPLSVTIKTGPNWLDLSPVKIETGDRGREIGDRPTTT